MMIRYVLLFLILSLNVQCSIIKKESHREAASVETSSEDLLCGKELVDNLCSGSTGDTKKYDDLKKFTVHELLKMKKRFLPYMVNYKLTEEIKIKLKAYQKKTKTQNQVFESELDAAAFSNYLFDLGSDRNLTKYDEIDVFTIYMREKIVKFYAKKGISSCSFGKKFSLKECLLSDRIQKDFSIFFQSVFLKNYTSVEYREELKSRGDLPFQGLEFTSFFPEESGRILREMNKAFPKDFNDNKIGLMFNEIKSDLIELLKENDKWDDEIEKTIQNIVVIKNSEEFYKVQMKNYFDYGGPAWYSYLGAYSLVQSQLEFNASLLGGKLIEINRSLLAYLPEETIYFVLAHELAHAIDTTSIHKNRFKKAVKCLEKKFSLDNYQNFYKTGPIRAKTGAHPDEWIPYLDASIERLYYKYLYTHYGWFHFGDRDVTQEEALVNRDQTGEAFADFIATELFAKKIQRVDPGKEKDFVYKGASFFCYSEVESRKRIDQNIGFSYHMPAIKRIQLLLSQPELRKAIGCSAQKIPRRYRKVRSYHSKSCSL